MIFVGIITLAGCYELFLLFLQHALTQELSAQAFTMWINTMLVGDGGNILAVIVVLNR